MTEGPFEYPAGLPLVAATPAAGFALQNATPTILSWTAPSDGQQHVVMLATDMHVTSAQTGGAVVLNTTLPDSTPANPGIYAGGLGAGVTAGPATMRIVGPGTTVTLAQSTAQTIGAALLWAALFAL